MTPEDIIKAIREGWPRSAAATTQFWLVEYERQLRPFAGEDLARGWRRILENNPDGTPPKPDRIAAMCRELRRESQPVPRKNTWTPPPSKKLSPEAMANINREMDGLQKAINNGTAGPLAPTLLRVNQGILDAHQKAVSDGRGI